MTTSTFATATAVHPLTTHTYSATFPSSWCIGNVPHGGYIASVFQTVTHTHFTTTLSHLHQPHTTSLHLSFLRRTRVGPAVFIVEDIKLGRQTSVVHVTLRQPEEGSSWESAEDVVVGYFTHVGAQSATKISEQSLSSTAAAAAAPSYDTNWTLTPPPLPIDVAALNAAGSSSGLFRSDSNWLEIPSLPFSEFRRASNQCRFVMPRKGQVQQDGKPVAYLDQWMALRSGEAWTIEALGFVADMFPQVVEALAVPGIYDVSEESTSSSASRKKDKPVSASHWYPTLVLNLDIKKQLLPAPHGPKWLFSRVQTKQVRDGRYDLEITILDETGDVVALSNHVCLVLPAGRNLAARGKGKKVVDGGGKSVGAGSKL